MQEKDFGEVIMTDLLKLVNRYGRARLTLAGLLYGMSFINLKLSIICSFISNVILAIVTCKMNYLFARLLRTKSVIVIDLLKANIILTIFSLTCTLFVNTNSSVGIALVITGSTWLFRVPINYIIKKDYITVITSALNNLRGLDNDIKE